MRGRPFTLQFQERGWPSLDLKARSRLKKTGSCNQGSTHLTPQKSNIVGRCCPFEESESWIRTFKTHLRTTCFHPLLFVFFMQSAHLAMIDTLMMAYTVEMVSVEKVMTCIHQYSCGNTEEETPYDTEDAVTTWINKVCVSVFSLLNLPYC